MITTNINFPAERGRALDLLSRIQYNIAYQEGFIGRSDDYDDLYAYCVALNMFEDYYEMIEQDVVEDDQFIVMHIQLALNYLYGKLER